MKRLATAGLGLLSGALGALFGSVPSGTEPDGEWVYCGRALFHDWNRLPHPDCAGSFEPFRAIALALFVACVALLLFAALQSTAPGRAEGAAAEAPHHPATQRGET